MIIYSIRSNLNEIKNANMQDTFLYHEYRWLELLIEQRHFRIYIIPLNMFEMNKMLKSLNIKHVFFFLLPCL